MSSIRAVASLEFMVYTDWFGIRGIRLACFLEVALTAFGPLSS